MSGPIRGHLRSNVVGYIALFFALTGGAYALQGKNTVNSGDIKPKNVKRSDLAPNSVDGSKVADNSLSGADVDESSLNIDSASTAENADTLDGIDSGGFLASSAQAGGDIGGPFANLQISPNAVGSSEVATDSLGAADIDESSLGFVGGPGLDMYFGREQMNAGPPAEIGETPIISVPGVVVVKGARTGNDVGSTQCGVGFENESGGNLQLVRFATTTAGDPSPPVNGGESFSDGSGDDIDPGVAAAGYARWLACRTPDVGPPL